LLFGSDNKESGGVRKVLLQLVTNPLLLACVLGVAYGQLGMGLPWAVNRGLEALGRMALPLALIGLGASLVENGVRGQIGLSVCASVLKLLIAPVVGFLVGTWIGLTSTEMTVALIFLATPTAINSYILAEQMGGDEALAATAVVICTLLSVVALAVVLSLVPG
jgi:predicted permease